MQALQKRYCLSSGIRIRHEEFGGTLYNHKTGTIIFIYSKEVLTILENGGEKTIAEMLPQEMNDVVSKVINLLENLNAKGLINEVD